MKKFIFQLQALMTIREWDEKNAHQELGRVNARIVEVESKMSALRESEGKMRHTWNPESGQRFNAATRIALDVSLKEISDRIEQLDNELEVAQRERLAALTELEATSRRKKIVENLREKRLAEYQAAYDKHEASEIEDSFYARRKNASLL